jgi:hypothetical protein
VSRVIDLTGRHYGRLTVRRRAGSDRHGKAVWLCLCDPELGGCGAMVPSVRGADLRDGTTTSCGCAQAATIAALTRTEAGRRHLRRLVEPIWPGVCDTCARPFVGTARQQYCCPQHRPSHPGGQGRPED